MTTWLPLKQLIYDSKGLYEKYEMKSFMLNPPFSDAEFTPEYKDYKF
jgi:outer membrane lipoprotein-sorting protein